MVKSVFADVVLNGGCREREDPVVLDLGGFACVDPRNVGNINVRKRIIVGLVAALSSKLYGTAVHVELSVSNAVKPRHGNGGLSGRDVLRNLVVVSVRVDSSRVRRRAVIVQVSGWATTLDTVDDLPHAVWGRVGIV